MLNEDRDLLVSYVEAVRTRSASAWWAVPQGASFAVALFLCAWGFGLSPEDAARVSVGAAALFVFPLYAVGWLIAGMHLSAANRVAAALLILPGVTHRQAPQRSMGSLRAWLARVCA